MAYEIEWQGSVVHVRLSGAVDSLELAEVVNRIAAHPTFDEQRYHVVHCTAATLPVLDQRVLDAMTPVVGATATNPYINMIFVPDTVEIRALVAFCSPVMRGLRSVNFKQDRAEAEEWIAGRSKTLPKLVLE